MIFTQNTDTEQVFIIICFQYLFSFATNHSLFGIMIAGITCSPVDWKIRKREDWISIDAPTLNFKGP